VTPNSSRSIDPAPVTERPDDLLRFPDIEARYGIKIATQRHMRANRQGPACFVLCGRVVAYRADVDAWIEAQRAAQMVGV
jgi:predicted DNA-binding transcriptional regulator AlpA